MIIVELFFNESCADFHRLLSGIVKFPKKIHSSQKYQGVCSTLYVCNYH